MDECLSKETDYKGEVLSRLDQCGGLGSSLVSKRRKRMNCPVMKTLLTASTLALVILLVSACATEYQGGSDQPATQETGASPGAEVDIGDVDQPTEVESGQAESPPGAQEEVGGVHPEDTPTQEERNAILDRVNRGGPLLRSGCEETSEGPEPGTESNIEQ
jgi:hypothetical protein